jgi:hypothetical protein
MLAQFKDNHVYFLPLLTLQGDIAKNACILKYILCVSYKKNTNAELTIG